VCSVWFLTIYYFSKEYLPVSPASFSFDTCYIFMTLYRQDTDNGAKLFLRSRQLLSYSRIPEHFMELGDSSPRSREPVTDLYPRPDESPPNPLSLRSILMLSSHDHLSFPMASSYEGPHYAVFSSFLKFHP
jgi:hypothetical protein